MRTSDNGKMIDMNDKLLSEDIKRRVDALQFLAENRMDFIEEKGLLNEFNVFLEKRFKMKNPFRGGNKSKEVNP